MKLSRASLYAVSALASMAAQKEGVLVAAHHMAQGQGIPRKYLPKILGSLAKAGILHSLKGPHGGYRLARPAAKITLLDIIAAMDGPVQEEIPPFLGEKAAAKLREVYGQIADNTRKQLGKVRLTDLGNGGAE